MTIVADKIRSPPILNNINDRFHDLKLPKTSNLSLPSNCDLEEGYNLQTTNKKKSSGMIKVSRQCVQIRY